MESSSSTDMSLEMIRVASFGQNPLKPVTSIQGITDFTPIPSSLKLSKAGFYRDPSSEGDEVRCFSCGLVMKDWSAYYGESPFSVHLCRSPECQYLSCQSNVVSSDEDEPSPCFTRTLTPQSPELFLTEAESTIVRRQLFPEDYYVRTNDNSLTNSQVQSSIKLPFKPKFGNSDMLFESKRHATFAAKPCLKAKELASNGFIMLTGDKIGCVFCGKQTTCPTAECTTPVKDIHRALNPNCSFFRGFDVSNVSCVLEESIKRNIECSDSNNSSDSEEDINNTTSSSAPCMFHNPYFEDFTVRRETFKDWPPQMKPTAQQLSEAGFYYTGTFDKVACFTCGCSLSKWQTDADALVQHAKHSPSCLYLRQLSQYHDIKQLAMETQEMTTCEMPTEDGPVSNESPVKLPFPFKPTVDPSILTNCQAALANSYPNYDLLVGWMLTTKKEFQMVREMRSNIHSQEVTLEHKDQQIHEHRQQIHEHRQQIHHKDQQIHQQGQQLGELSSKDEEIHQLKLKLSLQTQQNSQKDQQISQITQQNQQITQQLNQRNRLISNKNEILQVQGGRIDQLEEDNIRMQNLVMQLRRELQVSTSRRG
ncbi:E3 ubiquitin-protein ligase XIAP-like isoform X2 [Haliotis rufescens]|uniref:E3 ubiquitin-protein ligase XIAP-like isoform X2 n=1 Tax=Haliotis rufescens TaxID=6454 RepID=UPI00201EF939|nr:E3 ubiquitin-protein ligase XIAP-like isoform X2 [Haliotis rufescens]